MKKLIFIYILLAFSTLTIYAVHPVVIKKIIKENDTIALRLNNYIGEIQWQSSYDIKEWIDIENETESVLFIIAKESKFYRAKVTVGICEPSYSEIFQVIVEDNQSTVNYCNALSHCPDNQSINISTFTSLNWDLESSPDNTVYDLYFGKNTDPELFAEGLTTNFYNLENLETSTTYYWKVVQKSGDLIVCESEIWSFTTREQIPMGGTCPESPFVKDYDGNTYNTVLIGEQCWMAENLKVTHYANGDKLVDGSGVGAINTDNKTKYWFTFNDSETNKDYHGLLYTFAAASNGENGQSQIQGVCPEGWHLPSDNEWQQLELTIGLCESEIDSTGPRGSIEALRIKSTDRWYNNSNGNNISGFSATANGYYRADGLFGSRNEYGLYWTSTPSLQDGFAWRRRLNFENNMIDRDIREQTYGFSVRCIKN